MKRILSFLLCLAVLLSLAACKNQEPEQVGPDHPGTVEGATVPEEYVALWDGDWYGWWSITRSGGVYAELSGGSWWDACARIDIKKGTLVLWDELSSEAEPLAELDAWITTDEAYPGCLMAGNGNFINMSADRGYWLLSPNGSVYENAVCVTGRYDDPENPGSYFEYFIVLRPWGTTWDDLPEDQRPFHYDDWYLPLLEKNTAMPGDIS